MTSLSSYRELIVWQKSMDLTVKIYRLTRQFPAEERYGITSQMRRAAASIRANIAEGQARRSTGEFLQSLGVARGSLAELETFLILSTRLDMTTPDDSERLLSDCVEINKMLNALIKSISTLHSPLTSRHYSQVFVHGVDVFHPNTGEIRSDSTDGIACWFIDTDYNAESFFVRHSYFLGANDPYKALKTTLKAEINREAWESLHSDTSRPFEKPASGRIAVKVINHLGDEVMKVFRV